MAGLSVTIPQESIPYGTKHFGEQVWQVFIVHLLEPVINRCLYGNPISDRQKSPEKKNIDCHFIPYNHDSLTILLDFSTDEGAVPFQ